MDARRSPRREVAREQRDRGEKQRNDAVRRDVSRVDTEEKRGHEPGEKEGRHDSERDAESGQLRAIVDTHLVEPRHARPPHGDEKTNSPVGEAEPDQSPDKPENETFAQELAGESLVRSQGGAHGDLLLAPVGANQKQVG